MTLLGAGGGLKPKLLSSTNKQNSISCLRFNEPGGPREVDVVVVGPHIRTDLNSCCHPATVVDAAIMLRGGYRYVGSGRRVERPHSYPGVDCLSPGGDDGGGSHQNAGDDGIELGTFIHGIATRFTKTL